MNPSGQQLVIILLIVLLLFGAKRLPDLAKSMGTSIKEFRSATRDAMDENESEPSGDASSDSDQGH